MDYVIFTDTDNDIDLKVAKKYGYHLISMPYSEGEKEIYPYVDFEEFDYKTFYKNLRNGAMPKTSGLSPETYRNYFEPFLKEGKDILYAHFSSKMSGTFDAMRIAVKELKELYPNNDVYTLDTKGITICGYNIACEVGDMYLQGKTIKEILEWGEKEVTKFAIFFFAEDLSFFKRSGRVKSFTAFMGNLLGIKPIITMDEEGYMLSIDKGKGTKATIQKMLGFVKDMQDDIKAHRVVIGHSDNEEVAKMFADKLKEEYGEDLNIETVLVNPTAGSHCGPDGVGVCFHSKHR